MIVIIARFGTLIPGRQTAMKVFIRVTVKTMKGLHRLKTLSPINFFIIICMTKISVLGFERLETRPRALRPI